MSEVIEKAAEFARKAHEWFDQRRKYTGEPYIVHPQAVAKIVATVPHDEEMLAAAWLHDVVEDTPVKIDEIDTEFGSAIAALVSDLTYVTAKADGNRARRMAIDREHSARASARAKTVKLADVIDNLTGIAKLDQGFASRFVAEKELLLGVLEEGDPTLYRRAEELIQATKNELRNGG
jgi:(p)ppGpp synthase/HD superfamily hydrolase